MAREGTESEELALEGRWKLIFMQARGRVRGHLYRVREPFFAAPVSVLKISTIAHASDDVA